MSEILEYRQALKEEDRPPHVVCAIDLFEMDKALLKAFNDVLTNMNCHTLVSKVTVVDDRLFSNGIVKRISRGVLVNPRLMLPDEMSDEEHHKALTLWDSLYR